MQQSQPFVRLLLEHGADPNARVCFLTFVQQGKPGSLDGCTVERGLTPLMLASRFARSSSATCWSRRRRCVRP
jgi:ankyrin repeat protein